MEYGKMLAILGSPGSGKTTAAVKLACALACSGSPEEKCYRGALRPIHPSDPNVAPGGNST